MLRLLHTADVHLDAPFSGAGLSLDQARERRADLLRTFTATCELAKTHEVDLFLIAGDLFEEEYLSPTTLRTVMDLLAEVAPIPVVISPGNHDHYHATSPYRVEKWPDNVHIFTRLEPDKFTFTELDLTVHGCAFTAPHVHKAVWDRFRIDHTRSLGINVLCTHAAFYTGEPGQAANYLPLALAQLQAIGADYTALGHYHRGFYPWEDTFSKSVRAAYPGSPEPMHWRGDNQAGALIITIDEEKKSAKAEKIPLAQKQYHEAELDAGKLSTPRDYKKAIEELCSSKQWGARDLVRITINGRHEPELPVNTAAILENDYPLFALALRNRATPDYDLEALAGERSVRGIVIKALLQTIENGDSEERAIARQALNLTLNAFDGIDPGEVPI